MTHYNWGCNVQKRTITAPTSKIRKLRKIVRETNGRIESVSSQKDDTTKVNLIFTNSTDRKDFFSRWEKCLNPECPSIWKRFCLWFKK